MRVSFPEELRPELRCRSAPWQSPRALSRPSGGRRHRHRRNALADASRSHQHQSRLARDHAVVDDVLGPSQSCAIDCSCRLANADPNELIPELAGALKTQIVRKPPASSPAARATMRANRPRNTGPERAIRRELFARGLRYRIHRRPLVGFRSEADIVFPSERVAVFIDGCFWHGCPEHSGLPKSNREFWQNKLTANVDRDRISEHVLGMNGWLVLSESVGTRGRRQGGGPDRGDGTTSAHAASDSRRGARLRPGTHLTERSG